MKNFLLLEARKQRAQQAQHLEHLRAIHCATEPPAELRAPPPRQLRWKPSLKAAVTMECVTAIVMTLLIVWMAVGATCLIRGFETTERELDTRLRQKIEKTEDLKKRQELEDLRVNPSRRKLHDQLEVMICAFLLAWVFVALAHSAGPWFLHYRPTLRLLRDGQPARASVTARKRKLWVLPVIEFGFTTERGAHFRRLQPVTRTEWSSFNVGDPVWVLYMPSRPRLARIYGLKGQLADIAGAA